MTARLEDVLVSRGLLSAERVAEAWRDHALGGGQLDTVLLELGGLSESELLSALALASDVQPLHLGDYEPNKALAGELARDIAERLEVVPVSTEGTTLHVASAFPVPQLELEALGDLQHRRLVPWVAVSARVRDWQQALYGLPVPAREAAVLAVLEPHRPLPTPTPKPQTHPGLEEGLTLEELLAREILGPEKAPPASVVETLPEAPEPPPTPKAAKPVERAKTEREFPMLGTSAFPLAPPGAPAKPAAAEAVVEWSLEEARSALRNVTSDREAIKDVALRFGRRTFDYLAAFAVVRGKAVGWDALGEGADKARLQQLSVPLDVPSLFRTAALAHSAYAGPLPKDELTRDVLQKLRRAPRTVFLHPVEVKGRLVAMVYGDSAGKPVSQRRLADFRLFCQELSGAFSELLVLRRQLLATAPRPDAPSAAVSSGPPSQAPGVAAPRPSGWAPGALPVPDSLGRAVSRPGPGQAEGARPPPDFQPLLAQLVGTEPTGRARAMAEFARTPEPAARVLAAAFPGPTAWSRTVVEELPEADELGPIPGALVRLGRAGASALAPLLDAPSADTRYFALLAAGNLRFPEVVAGVLRGIFDLIPELSSAARLAARALRYLPRFETAMPSLRQELAARDPMRRILAARALGALRDRHAVEGLIGLTGSDDMLCATAAAEALSEITRASFGNGRRAWVAWWAENRRRTRAQWLLAALRHADVATRRAAIEELSSALGETLGYSADGPEKMREPAVQRWELALPDKRLKALD